MGTFLLGPLFLIIFLTANMLNRIAITRSTKPLPRNIFDVKVAGSIGQVMTMLSGAGAVPSLATKTARSSPDGTVKVLKPGAKLSLYHKSDPAGLANSPVPNFSETASESPSWLTEAVAWLLSPTQEDTSVSAPTAINTDPSPEALTAGSPGIRARASGGITR